MSSPALPAWILHDENSISFGPQPLLPSLPGSLFAVGTPRTGQ